MKKSVPALLVTALLASSVSAFPGVSHGAPAPKVNGTCSRAGARTTVRGAALVCTRSGNRLVWRAAPASTTTAPLTTAAATTAAPTTRATTTPAVDRSDIVIGATISRSAPIPAIGGQEAVEAFFEDLNSKGGINGRKVKLVAIDDSGVPDKNATAVKRLIESEKAVAILDVGFGAILGGSPAAAAAKVPVLGCSSAPACFGQPNMFPPTLYYQRASPQFLIDFLVKNNTKRVAVLTLNNPAATAGLDFYRQFARERGVQVTFDALYQPGETDFTAYAARIIASGAQAFSCLCIAANSIAAFRALQQQGYQGDLLVANYSSQIPTQVGSFANGRLYATSASLAIASGARGEQARQIIKKYNPSLDTEQTSTFQGWTVAELVTEAIRRIGDKPVTSQAITDALNTFKDFETTFFPPVSYDSGHVDVAKCIQLLLVGSNGQWQTVRNNERVVCL